MTSRRKFDSRSFCLLVFRLSFREFNQLHSDKNNKFFFSFVEAVINWCYSKCQIQIEPGQARSENTVQSKIILSAKHGIMKYHKNSWDSVLWVLWPEMNKNYTKEYSIYSNSHQIYQIERWFIWSKVYWS